MRERGAKFSALEFKSFKMEQILICVSVGIDEHVDMKQIKNLQRSCIIELGMRVLMDEMALVKGARVY